MQTWWSHGDLNDDHLSSYLTALKSVNLNEQQEFCRFAVVYGMVSALHYIHIAFLAKYRAQWHAKSTFIQCKHCWAKSTMAALPSWVCDKTLSVQFLPNFTNSFDWVKRNQNAKTDRYSLIKNYVCGYNVSIDYTCTLKKQIAFKEWRHIVSFHRIYG